MAAPPRGGEEGCCSLSGLPRNKCVALMAWPHLPHTLRTGNTSLVRGGCMKRVGGRGRIGEGKRGAKVQEFWNKKWREKLKFFKLNTRKVFFSYATAVKICHTVTIADFPPTGTIRFKIRGFLTSCTGTFPTQLICAISWDMYCALANMSFFIVFK